MKFRLRFDDSDYYAVLSCVALMVKKTVEQYIFSISIKE